MKIHTFIYWSTTGLIALMMSYSVYAYLTNEEIKGVFAHLGFPDYFRVELAIAKIFGVLFLVMPQVPVKLKEFTYFGFFVTFISAFIAHGVIGDPVPAVAAPIVFAIILIASYNSFSVLNENKAE